MAQRFFTPNEQFYDGAGNPMAGGQLFFFASGTSTPQNTFNDSGLTIANPNPVVLDSAGRAGSIFLGSNAYKVVLQDSLGNLIWTFDPVSSPPSSPIFLGSVTTGSANSQVLGSVSPSGYSRAPGNIIEFIAGFTNTTGMTLNVVSTGAVNVKKMSAAGPVNLTGGEVVGGTSTGVVDDGTQYVLISGYAESGFAVLASATTTNIGATGQQYVQITGTTAITAFDIMPAGVERTIEFAGILTLTNNASVILPGGQNITTAAGDVAAFRAEGAGVWRCTNYAAASGRAVFSGQINNRIITSSGTFVTPANTNTGTTYKFTIIGGGGAGGSVNGGGGSEAGGGGGGGGTAILYSGGLAAGASVAVTVGAGGTATAGTGNNGGNSSVVLGGVTVTGAGGAGGPGGGAGSPVPGGSGGTATNGSLNVSGQAGGNGNDISSANVTGGTGGSSTLGGGGGGGVNGGGTGSAGSLYGGGGGGASVISGNGTATAGAGGQGLVLVEWVQ